jgi:hypothetical protein
MFQSANSQQMEHNEFIGKGYNIKAPAINLSNSSSNDITLIVDSKERRFNLIRRKLSIVSNPFHTQL